MRRIQTLSSKAVIIALVGLLEAIVIAKTFARKNKYDVRDHRMPIVGQFMMMDALSLQIEPSQELVALGAANLVGSFFQAFPVTGSFSRSAMNSASGVRTPLGGVIVGLIVIVAVRTHTCR